LSIVWQWYTQETGFRGGAKKFLNRDSEFSWTFPGGPKYVFYFYEGFNNSSHTKFNLEMGSDPNSSDSRAYPKVF